MRPSCCVRSFPAAANVGAGAAQLPAQLLLREGQHGLEAILAGGDDVAAYQTVTAEEQVGLHAVRHLRVVGDGVGEAADGLPGAAAEGQALLLLQLQIVAPLGLQILRQLEIQRLHRLRRYLPAQTFQVGHALVVGGKIYIFTGGAAAEAAGQQQGHAGDEHQRGGGQQEPAACKAHMYDVQVHHLSPNFICISAGI